MINLFLISKYDLIKTLNQLIEVINRSLNCGTNTPTTSSTFTPWAMTDIGSLSYDCC